MRRPLKLRRDLTVLTTGDVARLASCSPLMVRRWFADGKLAGWHAVPGSKHRRFDARVVGKFLVTFGIKPPEELRVHYPEVFRHYEQFAHGQPVV